MRPSRFPVTWFFVLLFALQAPRTAIFRPFPTSLVPQFLWPYLACPSLVGLLIILWLQGLPGIRNVLYKLTPWATGRAWPMLAVCALLPLACLPLFVAFLAASGAVPSLSRINLSAYFYAAFIGKGLLGPGLLEEIGWRGFALPCLQRRWSALASSIVIGFVHALWHFPFFVYDNPFPWRYLILFVPQVIVLSVIFTWAYNTTSGSLLAVILLHGAIDARQYLADWRILPDTATTQILEALPFLLIAVGLLWRYGPSNLSRRTRVMALLPEPLTRTAESDLVQVQTSPPNDEQSG
jgi:membrane protease YdiL (CAAX protease family)